MIVELHITGGTDKTVRFEVIINGENTGELQINRSKATKVWDLLLNNSYHIGK